MFKRLTHLVASALIVLGPASVNAENDNFTTTTFSGSGNCIMCHDGLRDSAGNDVSIVRDWNASMMANASKDPFWRAKLATELQRNPQLASVINDKCTKCHAPMANYEISKNQGADIEVLGPNGILNNNHPLHDAALNGVSCTLCHQVSDDPSLGTLAGFSGHYHINNSKTIYGQYADIFANPMINATGYRPEYSAHVSSSEMCATCHELSTPYVDANGNILTTTPETEFPEQTPYSEWLNSIYADGGSDPQSCQDCHMPQTTAKVSNRPRWLAAKDGFAQHHLVGANTTMLTLLRDNAAALDVTSNNMDLGIERARAMLQSSVSLEIVSAAVNNGFLEVQVRLTNRSGHKTPTAYPSRRMWLNFRVTDASNNVLFESGRINADGSIEGADNDVDQTRFEPHYQLIQSPDQVQIYETIMGNSDNQLTYTLLRAAQYLKDNRLTPQGFNKRQVADKVAVWGQAANDADFDNGSDLVTYRVPASASGDLNIDVSLKYQTIMHGFIADLYADSELPEVQTFRGMYDAQALKHETITSAQTVVTNTAGPPPAPLPTTSLVANPASAIDPGQSVQLSWSSSDADTCAASWTGSTATSGSETLWLGATTTYAITCSGAGGSSSDSVTVTLNDPVAPAPTVTLSADPATAIDVGASATLSWASTDATGCSSSWSGDVATSGSLVVTPTVTTSYSISCSGAGGTASDTLSITVNEPPALNPPTVTLNASPASIRRGGSITLSWSSTDAVACDATGIAAWSGTKPTSGSQSVTLNEPATLALTCSGAGGTASDAVTYRARGGRWLNLQ